MSGAAWFDERADELQQGIDDLAAGDELRQTNQLLALLVREMTSEGSESYFESGFEPREPGESDDGRKTASYSSREGITAADDAQRLDFGLTADTVVIRNVDETLGVAFKDPSNYDDAIITIEPTDSPFILSGVYGIATDRMWFESGTANDHDFDIIAVKKRGR